MTISRIKKDKLNNEMIKMRKEIKKASIKIIRKLNKDANSYLSREYKKGKEKNQKIKLSDEEKAKFKRRAERMKEKANIYKKIKLNPDEVFKAIIYPNWTKESLTDDPKVEAFMKIANDSKIQQKLKSIRQEVKEFSENRASAKPRTCLETEKDSNNTDGSDGNVAEEEQDESEVMECEVSAAVASTSDATKDAATAESSLIATQGSSSSEVNLPGEELPGELPSETYHNYQIDDSDESDPQSSDESSVEMDFNDMVSQEVRDVGEILHNKGAKYDDGEMKIQHSNLQDSCSEDESSSDDDDDGFFTNQNLNKFAKTSSDKPKVVKCPPKTKKSVQKTQKIKSSNVPKEKDVSSNKAQAPKKKKNRPGQRTRKLMAASLNPTSSSSGKNSSKTGSKPGRKDRHTKKAAVEEASEEVHPSWQASQLKKKQSAIQKFEGTRITFSDSD